MRTNRHRRLIAYGLLAIGALVLVGWLRYEQQRSFARVIIEEEPVYPAQHPTEGQICEWVAQTPDNSARLEIVARQFTQRFRQHDVPLRARRDGETVRLYVAVSIPRWYTARVARQIWKETLWATGREPSIPIYETYVLSHSRQIGVCARNPDSGEVEVRLIR